MITVKDGHRTPTSLDRTAALRSTNRESGDGGQRVPQFLRFCLTVTLAVNSGIAGYLAVYDFALAQTALDTVGSALLLTVSITCLWALVNTLRCSSNWLLITLASQVLVALLAGYVWLMDQRSPVGQLSGVVGAALVIGAIAIAWVLYLGRHAHTPFTRSLTALVALFPLLGLVQFWMESDYLPRTTRPLVDIEVTLTPTGTSGSTVHLLAQVILHNRGTVQANVVGTLMRVTGYPVGGSAQPATVQAVSDGFDLTGSHLGADYRTTPTPPADAKLLYSDDFSPPGSFLTPGGTMTYKRMISFDTATLSLARLSVTAAFLTERRIAETRTCFPPRVSLSTQPLDFRDAVTELLENTDGAHYLCVETEIAPSGVIQALVSDQPMLRLYLVINNPVEPTMEFPQLFAQYGTRQTIDNPAGDAEAAQKIDGMNPSVVYTELSAEYAPKDQDFAPAK